MTNPTRPLIDTHFHLDLYPNPGQVVRRVEEAEVYTIAVTNTPSVFEHTAAFAAGCEFVRPALGLHPELAAERAGELDLMQDLLARTRYVGEVGLDYTTSSRSNRQKQRKVFEKILAACAGDNKVLTIHSRRAAGDVVDMLKGFKGAPVLHWYSGSKRTLKKAVSYGCYFSINPAMIKSSKFETLLSWIPKELLLTETDGPFVEAKNGPAMPADTLLVIKQISRLWGTSERKVQKTLYSNFRRILQVNNHHAKDLKMHHEMVL